ncbi:MAG: hypothetical protein L3K04_00875 [Thermoplasmata archaeon]|nr:hypothetical protein [Thermoplasmata archaeon]MCI4337696.1 hypothetical protein [Thermoplasmata archaeon]MCI4340830.1 hypothetical protein [Thermoplasmata archaeon]
MTAPDHSNANYRPSRFPSLDLLRRTRGSRWAVIGVLALLLLLPVSFTGGHELRPNGATPAGGNGRLAVHADGSPAPNLSLSHTNGSMTISAKLWYVPSAYSFAVNATVVFSGGTGPYTLLVGWGDTSSWSYGNRNATANSSTTLSTSYNASALYPFEAFVSDSLGNGSQVTGTIRAVVPNSMPGIPVTETDQDLNSSWTSTFWYGPTYGGTPNYTLVLDFGDGGTFNTTLGLGSSGSVDHTYSAATGGSYAVQVLLHDAAGMWGNSSLSVNPSYLGNGSRSGGSGGPAAACAQAVFCAHPYAYNGGFGIHAVVILNQSQPSGIPFWGQVNVTGVNGTVNYTINFGDGGGASFANIGSARTLTFAHTYAMGSPGQQVNWSIAAVASTGAVVSASATLPIGSNGSRNSSGYTVGSFPCANATCLYVRNSLGPIQYAIDFRLNNSSGPFPMAVNGSFSGGVPPIGLLMQFGDGYAANWSLNSTPGVFGTQHSYAFAGSYNWSLGFRDANGTGVIVQLPLTVGPAGSGGGNNSSARHPAPVSVVVAASPVTGSSPLAVVFSAYIDGGSPPFAVHWSLPNGSGNGTGSATGLMASAFYSVAGWYPATAFVYNTTNAYGTVLVGYGSVWVYVTGGSGGNGSPNGSSNQSIRPGSAGATPGGQGGMLGGLLAGTTFVALLLALAFGGLVGAILGFAFGRGGRPPRTPPSESPPG